jgi:hypothetical protein
LSGSCSCHKETLAASLTLSLRSMLHLTAGHI